jgi:hypothetical protein
LTALLHITQSQRRLAQILTGGAWYFALVFGAGFVLGSIRVVLVVPRLGERTAEVLEAPLMLVVTILAARWVVARLALPPSPLARLGVGCVALGLLLATEFTVVLWVRGLTVSDYFASRDPVGGTIYLLMLALFAVMPLFVAGFRA